MEATQPSRRAPFDPVAHGLNKDFQLTNYTYTFTDLKKLSELKLGWGCKVAPNDLNKLLEEFKEVDEDKSPEELVMQGPEFGVGSDCSVTPLAHGGFCLVETTDFVYPIVDDPYVMGQIACAHVLSDLYAMGVLECSNMMMLLSVPQTFTDEQREVIIPLMMRGFRDMATMAGTKVRGGQTVLNPWCSIGGTATSVYNSIEIVCPGNAMQGDVLVLTKPLGTQIAVTARQWLSIPDKKKKLNALITAEDVERAYQEAVYIMCKLNKTAASLMATYNAHGATDISGFGILGHAESLLQRQKEDISFHIHNLPVIGKMHFVSKGYNELKLLEGYSPETSGGLLIAFPREQAASFCKEMDRIGSSAWIIGIVDKGPKQARVIEKPRVIEVNTNIT